MTPEEWRIRAIAHLDKLDALDAENWGAEQPTANQYADLVRRYSHARQAFPALDWEAFLALDTKLDRANRKGRPKRSLEARAREPLWLAVRDADRVKQLWRALNPDHPRSCPPEKPHVIVAKRHGVKEQTLVEALNRPDSRRFDRLAARKKPI